MVDFDTVIGFDWDSGNARKNEKHAVSMADAEQLFFNAPLVVLLDDKHAQHEVRFHALGQSDMRRYLHVTFTLRQAGQLIRVISARDMNKKERAIYDQNQ